ncbi:MAG: hypothetical protein ACFE96_10385 [Candidatus Hermodarchaeota archaeon]
MLFLTLDSSDDGFLIFIILSLVILLHMSVIYLWYKFKSRSSERASTATILGISSLVLTPFSIFIVCALMNFWGGFLFWIVSGLWALVIICVSVKIFLYLVH